MKYTLFTNYCFKCIYISTNLNENKQTKQLKTNKEKTKQLSLKKNSV